MTNEQATRQHDPKRDAAIREIAKRETPFESLESTRSGADFREIAVWTLEQALVAAYEAGRAAGARSRPITRLTCPACKREIDIRTIG